MACNYHMLTLYSGFLFPQCNCALIPHYNVHAVQCIYMYVCTGLMISVEFQALLRCLRRVHTCVSAYRFKTFLMHCVPYAHRVNGAQRNKSVIVSLPCTVHCESNSCAHVIHTPQPEDGCVCVACVLKHAYYA